ncbi:hypothetical protein [Lentibacillus amyloliquefaciens]|nr:hypothetical protein [Lentibacillus amyloliquefaciens]
MKNRPSPEAIGPIIEHSSLFPERVNLGIAHVKHRQEIDYRVWEEDQE